MPKYEFSSRVTLKKAVVLIVFINILAATAGFTASRALAQTNDFLVYGTKVSGEVKTRAGEEWSFSGCAVDPVTIRMSSDELDSYVELYGPTSRRPLIDDDDSGGDGNALIEEFELPESGIYTIVAAGSTRKDRGEYTLALESTSEVDTDEEAALAYGETVVGLVATARGEEWWFWGCADDMVMLTMESDEFDGYLELYGPTGRRPLVEAAAGDTEDESAVVEISEFSLPESGLYSIVAAGQSRRDRGFYSLTLLTSPGEELDGEELDDTLQAGEEPGGEQADGEESDGENSVSDAVAGSEKIRRESGPRSISLPTADNGSLDDAEDGASTSVPTPEPGPTSTLRVRILVPTSAPVATSTVTSTVTPTVTPTSQPTLTPVAVATSTPVQTAVPGLVTDFETWGTWRRGDEAWGTFTQSDFLAHGGEYVGKFDYDFPANEPRNYLIYRQSMPISGKPAALTIWVYGDGSGNFLNAWVRDANDQSWQFTFGRINHAGWRQMRADLDLSLGWPNQAIDNTSATAVAYPIQFEALVLDGADEDTAYKGSVLVDDLFTTTAPPPRPTARPTARATEPRSTAEPIEEPSGPSVGTDSLPAPVAIGYHFPFYRWEWDGMPLMKDVDNWYFDVKIFDNVHSEYPYDVKVAEVNRLVEESPNVWRFDHPTEFRCGSFWAVQVALRNPDGSYAGPMSPESNRLPSGQGCEEELPGGGHGGSGP